MPTIQYPEGEFPTERVQRFNPTTYTNVLRTDEYIVQTARFDPSKGITDVLTAYEKFHKRYTSLFPDTAPPKLLICGHSSVDDPEGTKVYDSAVAHLEHDTPQIRPYACVMRIRPSDQMLNALVSKAKVALQLSTREGFEVKVSEVLHKGKPVVATNAGGLPLQVDHGKNGFLVEVGDTDAVAQHLLELFTDKELYNRMSDYAANSISDDVTTAGNSVDWCYMASKMTKGEVVEPNGRLINEMVKNETGGHQQEHRLSRKFDDVDPI